MPIPKYAILDDEESSPVTSNIPSYAIPDDDSSSNTEKQQSFTGKAEAFGKNALDFINKAGGTAGRAIGYGIADVANLPIDVANYANQKVAGLFGVKPENVPTPDDINPQSIPMPGVSQQAQQQLDPLARNITTGLETAPFVGGAIDATKLAASLGKNGLKTLRRKLGFAATQKSKDFMGDLLQGNKMSDSHLPVLDELRKNYSDAQDISNSHYGDILKEAAQQGYTGGKQFPGISVNTGEKSITPNGFTNQLDDIDLTAHSKGIQDLLTPFTKSVNNNLSFEKAHDLQSELGKQGAKLATNADGTQRYLGAQLLDLRNTLKDDITGSLASNGDTDLAKQYQDASDFFKTNVAPYRENSAIRKVVMGQGLKEVNPSNIGNVLKKDDAPIAPIVNSLSDKSKNLLLAQALKSSTRLSPNKAGTLSRITDPNSLVNSYQNLDNKGLSYLMTPESQMKIAGIMRDLGRQSKLKWTGGTTATLAGVGGIADLARKYL